MSADAHARSIVHARSTYLRIGRYSARMPHVSKRCNRQPHHPPMCVQSAANDGSKPTSSKPLPVPTSAQETVEQATSVVLRAYNEGITRQRVQFLLPLIGATELDDWCDALRHNAPVTHHHHAQARRHPPAIQSCRTHG